MEDDKTPNHFGDHVRTRVADDDGVLSSEYADIVAAAAATAVVADGIRSPFNK